MSNSQDPLASFADTALQGMNISFTAKEKKRMQNLIKDFARRRILLSLLAFMPEEDFRYLEQTMQSGRLSEQEELALWKTAASRVPDGALHMEQALRSLYYELIEDSEALAKVA